MVALVSTVAYLGLEARAIEVQCQIAPGMPKFNVVGLPDNSVRESRERVHSALSAMGLSPEIASTVIRVSFGPSTSESDIDRFLAEWRKIAARAKAQAA